MNNLDPGLSVPGIIIDKYMLFLSGSEVSARKTTR